MEETNHTIWIEKYRPLNLSQVVGQSGITERLKSYVKSGQLPHLLFTGSAGIGKTTSAVALAREFFGDSWRANFREMNASDERGIDAVRNQIKQFARTSPMGGAHFKMLFLDEADALTNDAQSALRRTMESYAESCRFVLSCNYSAKIIDPIQSRCAIYRFKPLDAASVKKEVERISTLEGVMVTPKGMDAIAYVAQGDMRRAINALQGAAILGKTIEDEEIYAITSMAKPDEITQLLKFCADGNFDYADKMLSHLMLKRGISPNELINQLYREILKSDMDRGVKVKLIDKIGETDFRLSEGANAEIQMEALIANFILASGGK